MDGCGRGRARLHRERATATTCATTTTRILENDYGISLRELVAFADRTYREDDGRSPLIKAINVLLFKLEGQPIARHPEFDMEDRLLLDKIDVDRGTVSIAGTEHALDTRDFPTPSIPRIRTV